MTKEEAHDALDGAVQDYAATVFAEDGSVGLVQWVLVAHVDLPEDNESGYTTVVSSNLALHNKLGLLRYASAQSDAEILN